MIELKSPILTNEEFAKLKHIDLPHFKSATLPILYKVDAGAAGLEKAMEALCARASRAIAECVNILIGDGVCVVANLPHEIGEI